MAYHGVYPPPPTYSSSSRIIHKQSTPTKKSLDETFIVNDIEIIDQSAVEATKLSSSWIALEDSMDKMSLDNSRKVELDRKNSETSKKSDKSSKSELYKLGYVIPDKESDSLSYNNDKYSYNANDPDDPGLVFISRNSDDDKSSDIVSLDSQISRSSGVLLENSSIYTNVDNIVANTSDSFCDLVAESGSSDMQSKKCSSKMPNGAQDKHSLDIHQYGDSGDTYSSSLFGDESVLHLPTNSVFNMDGASNRDQHLSGGKDDQSPQFQSSIFYYDSPVPLPPPEMGLPDLTKKQHFPKAARDESVAEGQSSDASAMVKNKVMGIWNNVKYGWSVSLGTNFSRTSPIVLLGNTYLPHPVSRGSDLLDVHINRSNSVSFKQAFLSVTWFTYRTKLPPIIVTPSLEDAGNKPEFHNSPKHLPRDMKQSAEGVSPTGDFTSDCGWGCTLRCTQMMLCHALHKHFLGDDWVYTPGSESIAMKVHSTIVRWFGDSTGENGMSPLSLHRILQSGYDRIGKLPGAWYSPGNAAAAIRDSMEAGAQYLPDLERVTVYSAPNNIIYIQDIVDQCWAPCICKMGKIAEYMKQQPPKQRSCCRSGSCDNALHASLRSSQSLSRHGTSASADMLSSAAADHSDGYSSFVQIDSLACDVGQNSNYSGRASLRNTPLNGDLLVNTSSRVAARSVFGRSLSVDESDGYHASYPRGFTDASMSRGHTDSSITRGFSDPSSPRGHNESIRSDTSTLNESFCELDVPTTPSPLANPTFYSKTSISQKLFGSYNPFKFGSKSSTNPAKSDYCSPVSVSTKSGKTRQESLQSETIEILSPILEQERLCDDCQSWRSLVIILAVRMGGDSFNSIYETVITGLLRHRLCIGLVGGKAKRAFYFAGYQEDQLLYLDPHVSQDAVPCSTSSPPDVSSYHCDSPRKMPISRLEPSATLGFYCHTRVDLAQLVVDLQKITTVREGRLSYPLVEVKAGSRQQQETSWAEDSCILTDLVTLDSAILQPPLARHAPASGSSYGEHKSRPRHANHGNRSHAQQSLLRKASAAKTDDFQMLD